MALGLSSPVAYCCTVNPAGAFGHMPSERETTLGPLLADSVAYGAGRSCAVILCTLPGCSYRKSINGGCGGGALVATGVVFEDAESTDAELSGFLSDFRYVTICHRFCSERLAQAGIPLLTDPVVMNQNTSPSDAD